MKYKCSKWEKWSNFVKWVKNKAIYMAYDWIRDNKKGGSLKKGSSIEESCKVGFKK